MDKEKNFEFFVNTIKSLALSQGFFGRILRQLSELESEELERLKADLPQFKDSLDVVFYFEQ
jgi:hypothetical protein